jgi:hypothetical protein
MEEKKKESKAFYGDTDLNKTSYYYKSLSKDSKSTTNNTFIKIMKLIEDNYLVYQDEKGDNKMYMI